MQLTNSLVTICCNNVLSVTSGDLYISVMTIVSSIRQIIDTPIHAVTEGSSPVISYNYGARRPKRVFQAGVTMGIIAILYTLLAWSVILFVPRFLIGIFSSDPTLIADAVPALKLYFGAFVFQALQYVGQTMFKSLGKKKFAIFFSLLRKGYHRSSAYLYFPLCVPYGKRRCIPCRTGVQRDRRQHMFYRDAVHRDSGAEKNGKRKSPIKLQKPS